MNKNFQQVYALIFGYVWSTHIIGVYSKNNNVVVIQTFHYDDYEDYIFLNGERL